MGKKKKCKKVFILWDMEAVMMMGIFKKEKAAVKSLKYICEVINQGASPDVYTITEWNVETFKDFKKFEEGN